MGDHNAQGVMTSNKILLTVAIYDLIVSEGLSFNIAQKSGSFPCYDHELYP